MSGTMPSVRGVTRAATSRVPLEARSANGGEPEWPDPPFVTRIRLRARRFARWLRHQWASAPGGAGLAIAHDEVDRILRSSADTALAERTFYEIDPVALALAGPIAD